MARIFYKPAPIEADKPDLRIVPDPARKFAPLPADGAWVDTSASTIYWARRVKEGDVIDDTAGQVEREAAAEAAAQAAAAQAAADAQKAADAAAAQLAADQAKAAEDAAAAEAAAAASKKAKAQAGESN